MIVADCRNAVLWFALEGFRAALSRKATYHAAALRHIRHQQASLGDKRLRSMWRSAVDAAASREVLSVKL